MKFSTSEQVIKAIEVKKRNGIDLHDFKRFIDSIGNPQLNIACIHVGGTNGKGSTTNALRCILQTAGYRVGTFTSPYLETHHDRIRINDHYIRDEVIVKYANTYYEAWKEYQLSMFEIDMFIAVQYFMDEQVDYAVFEVGLGGDQDATNIIQPLVSVITNIGMDHSEFLGTTYDQIARAKAGIIKENTALITAEKKVECLHIFKQVCNEKNAPFIQCKPIDNIKITTHLSFDYRHFHIQQPTLAAYQAMNSALAIETARYLQEHNLIAVRDEHIIGGIEKAIWKGRFEIVCKEPMIIIDGAHNLEGIQALVESCKGMNNLKILFSALKDKPYSLMLDELYKATKDVTVCTFDFERAAPVEWIAKDRDVRIIRDFKEAIELLKDKDGTLLICGSLYFISDVRKYLVESRCS